MVRTSLFISFRIQRHRNGRIFEVDCGNGWNGFSNVWRMHGRPVIYRWKTSKFYRCRQFRFVRYDHHPMLRTHKRGTFGKTRRLICIYLSIVRSIQTVWIVQIKKNVFPFVGLLCSLESGCYVGHGYFPNDIHSGMFETSLCSHLICLKHTICWPIFLGGEFSDGHSVCVCSIDWCHTRFSAA